MDATGDAMVRGHAGMNTTGNRSILQLRGVTKIFARGTIDEVTALDGINLDVYDQDFVTIIGSNGAGKSTLLNIIAGVFPPEKGAQLSLTVMMLPALRNISGLPMLVEYGKNLK